MANFVTADDKRIYDLQLLASVVANYSLPVDLVGNLAAKKITIQQLVDYVIANSSGIGVYAGNVNPDNAFGSNGDIYFTVPADGSRLQLFKKNDGLWNSVFNLPIASVDRILEIDYYDLEANHKTYIDEDLAGKTFKLYQNGINRFLISSEYIINEAGGFQLVHELSEGDVIMLIGQVAGVPSGTSSLSIETYATYTALNSSGPRPDGFYRVIVDDSPNGDGSESFFLSFQNRLFYDLLLDQQ